LAGQAAIQAWRDLLKQQCLGLAVAASGENVCTPLLASDNKAVSRASAGHRRAKDLVERIDLTARLAYLAREIEQLLLLLHLALRCGVLQEPAQSNCRLLCERKRRALIACAKSPGQTQAGVQLITQEYRNAQPSDIHRRRGQRRLKRRRALHQHRLACLDDTRQQMLSSRAQFDTIWQHMGAILRQYIYSQSVWQQNSRARAWQEITNICEEMGIYLTKIWLRSSLRGR
jgi:hypothetical protein